MSHLKFDALTEFDFPYGSKVSVSGLGSGFRI